MLQLNTRKLGRRSAIVLGCLVLFLYSLWMPGIFGTDAAVVADNKQVTVPNPCYKWEDVSPFSVIGNRRTRQAHCEPIWWGTATPNMPPTATPTDVVEWTPTTNPTKPPKISTSTPTPTVTVTVIVTQTESPTVTVTVEPTSPPPPTGTPTPEEEECKNKNSGKDGTPDECNAGGGQEKQASKTPKPKGKP